MSHTFSSYVFLMKNNLIKQTRSYSFLIVIGLCIFIGYACVPSSGAGYEVFYIGGVRGIYNSAWLGGMAAMLSTLLVWIFGFYMLRSQVSDDQRLKVGQIIAATPISNVRYISSKVFSNFLVLVVIEIIIVCAFMTMQIFRGENDNLQLWDYFGPFFFIAIPSFLVLSSLTVFFDVVSFLKGVMGNIIFFGLWLFFSVVSIALPNSFLDLYGLDTIRADMVEEASIEYPFYLENDEGGSFGYYPIEGEIATFEWKGVTWDTHILIQRIIWVFIAIIITLLSSVVFNRFKGQKRNIYEENLTIFKSWNIPLNKKEVKNGFTLSPIEKESRLSLFRLVRAELRIMLKGYSIWWYLLVIIMIIAVYLFPLEKINSWLPLILILPIAIWSQMGTREKYYFTREMILSSCPPFYKFFSVWISGILITFLMSSSALLRFLIEGEVIHFYLWIIGIFFINTLGLTLGILSGSRKLFEVIYMLWWYLGPMNNIPYLDFTGIKYNYSYLYLIITVLLLLLAIILQYTKTVNFKFGMKSRNKKKILKGEYDGEY